jgi:hypothetical protein
MAKLIIQNKKYLTDNNVTNFLYYAINKDEVANVVIQYIEDLTGSNVYNLLHYATNKNEIAQLLGSENINKLSDYDVKGLLLDATNPDEMRSVLQKYGRIQ